MIEAPPGRYRVIERGRRLVVIDNRTGQPAKSVSDPAESSASVGPPPAAFDDSGRPILNTSLFYDLQGPRSIVLTEDAQKLLGQLALLAFAGGIVLLLFVISYPWLLLALAIPLLHPAGRMAVRRAITAQLDRIA